MKLVTPVTVTPQTILEFDFRSSNMCEIAMIIPLDEYGLSNSDETEDTKFILGGSQTNIGGSEHHFHYAYTMGSPHAWQHFLVPIGMYSNALGRSVTHVLLVMDCDVGSPTGEMHFANLKLYEPLAALPSCPPAVRMGDLSKTTIFYGNCFFLQYNVLPRWWGKTRSKLRFTGLTSKHTGIFLL